MRKRFSIAMASALLVGLLSQSAQAVDFADADLDVNINICNVLTIKGFNSHFKSEDDKISAILHYNPMSGDGLTGQIRSAINGDNHQTALINSHCNNGIIRLEWLQPGFYGAVIGYIDLINKRISRLTGIINGEQVNINLIFTGYGK